MPNEATSHDLPALLKTAFKTPFLGALKIVLSDGATYWVNGTTDSPTIGTVAPKDAGPLCTWTTTYDTLERILEGARALENAFISGRLSISGDMSIMGQLELKGTYGKSD